MKYTMKQTMRGFLSVKVALNAKLTLHPGEWKLLAGSVYTVHVHYRTFFDRYRPSAMTFESAAPFFTIFNSGITLENGLHSNSQLEGYDAYVRLGRGYWQNVTLYNLFPGLN